MLVTYDILLKVPSLAIQQEYQIDQLTACDFFQFCRKMVLEFVESKSEMIGGEGKVVEIDDRKYGKGKYHRVTR
jgi:hypothetical protein